MILVTLGTQDKDFSRLLKAIDREIKNKNIKDKVIVQAGYTKYKSKNMEIFDLIPPDELEKLVKECKILITHGGVGSILQGLKYDKPIIAAPRSSKYKEHTNDHQKQIVKEFEKRGFLLELKDFNKLDELLKKAKTFHPNKYKSNNKNFIRNIDNYIEKDNHISWFNKYLLLTENGYRGVLFSILNLLIFYICNKSISLYYSILISFIITQVFSYLFHRIMNISYNIKNYLLNSAILLIIDFISMYLNPLNIKNIIIYKMIINIINIFIIYIITKFLLLKKN